MKPFRFDDIYLSIVAKKMSIKLLGSRYILNRRYLIKEQDLPDLIAVHEFDDSKEMEKLWKKLRSTSKN